MTYEIRQISDVGTAHPVVARLGPQASDLSSWLDVDKTKRDQIVHLYITTLRQRLLECHKVRNTLNEKMFAAVEGLPEKQVGNQIQAVPYILGLQKIVEGFLYDAKN